MTYRLKSLWRVKATRGFLIAALCSTGCSVPLRASISPEALHREVERAELDRDGTAPAIPPALVHHERELRLAALRALARIGEVGTSSLAARLLGDRDVEVATWAAFALGEIGEPSGEAALIASLRGVSPVPDQVLMALGRSGTATAARDVASMLSDPRPSVRAAASIAMGLMGKRIGKSFPAEHYAILVAPLVRDKERDVRFGAAYALMRLAGPTAAVALIPLLGDPDPEIRASAARGLGASKVSPQVLDSVAEDADWRVRVERVRALGVIGRETAETTAAVARLTAVVPREFERFKNGGAVGSGTTLHVLLEVVSACSEIGPEAMRVIALLEKTPWKEHLSEPAVPDLARLKCAIAYALDDAENVIRRVRGCGDTSIPAWRREQLVARLHAHHATDESVGSLVQLASNQDPRVRIAAVEALGEVDRASAVTALAQLLDSNDPFVVAASADGLSHAEHAQHRPADLSVRLSRALSSTIKEQDAGLSVPILDAIGALGAQGAALLPQLEALAADPRSAIRRRAAHARETISGKTVPFGRASGTLPFDRPDPVHGRVRLVLTTVRGIIEIELFGDLAPYTTGTLTSLARSGFFEGKTFHRIVSDFVAQGGCPRGDGWGSPGYTIEEELSPIPFVRGAVGIATSGRDTGGSQFFIMHTYHPHLDGAYAVVGRVVNGMDVVDALEQDDRILGLEAGADLSPGTP
jgi:cyclophilin family peptidyl-prolyl cis-trans isomerase/HEAT repeat protein